MDRAPQLSGRAGATTAWATVATVALALTAVLWPAAEAGLIVDRAAVGRGEWWRLWTGHAVHFGWSHLVWDAVVFGVAAGWLERIEPRLLRGYLLLAPPIIASAVLVTDGTLARYGGLSGVAAGVLVLLSLVQLRRDAPAARWVWLGVLALVSLKVGAEWVSGRPLMAELAGGARLAPAAHLAGIACAVPAAGLWRWRIARRPGDH